MTKQFPDDRIAQWFERYVDRRLGEAEADELLAAFQKDPALGELFYEQFRTDFYLTQYYGARSGLNPALDASFRRSIMDELFDTDELARLAAESPALPKKEPEREKNKPDTRRNDIQAYDAAKASGSYRTLAVLLPLILVLIATAVYFEWRPTKDEVGAELAAGTKSTPAVLVDHDDVRWTTEARSPRRGEPLSSGLLEFGSGTIELLFYNGVRSVVEGPAELLLIDEKRVFCKQGRWSVTVPEQGKGFEIQTPTLTVRDLGTEFYADIGPDQCDLHVLKGEVEMERLDGTKTLFHTGGGAVFRRDRPADPIVAEPGRFVSGTEMRRRGNAVLFRDGMPEIALNQSLKKAAIRTIDFRREPVVDATLSGGGIVEGETPGSRAFEFTGPEGQIRVRPAGELDSFSGLVRLRMNRLDRERNPVLMSEGNRKNGLVWHIPPDGRMIVGVRYQSTRSTGIFQTPIVFTGKYLGRTVDLGLVVDGSKQSMTVYFEGDPVLTARLPRPTTWNLNELDAGSWVIPGDDGQAVRQIDGRVERVLLFDRPLKLEEIRLLQEH